VWELWRRPYRGKTVEIFGEHIRSEDPRTCRSDIQIDPVVRRILKCAEVFWDRDPVNDAPQTAPIRLVERIESQEAQTPPQSLSPLPFDPRMRESERNLYIKAGRMLPKDEPDLDDD
jgi:hypothetical protein